jgi:hypothetical protein
MFKTIGRQANNCNSTLVWTRPLIADIMDQKERSYMHEFDESLSYHSSNRGANSLYATKYGKVCLDKFIVRQAINGSRAISANLSVTGKGVTSFGETWVSVLQDCE